MSINLIDPNEEILKNQNWFVRGDINNNIRIPDFQDIRSFVELSMNPKIDGYVEVDDKNIVKFISSNNPGNIVLSGFHTRKNSDTDTDKYYSTQYTDELMGNNGKNKDYEGFGIKSIEIIYDANKIPVVTIVFYDLRGNVLSNFDSKFAKMFQLPYPIFNLRIKGGFGPEVSYSLLKTRDDISIDEAGNFIITSKFVGNRFSPLADIPLLYLMAVPYLDGKKVAINDTKITSFHELIINLKQLYSKLEHEIDSEQERENASKSEEKRDKLDNLKTIYNDLSRGKTKIQEIFNESEEFKALKKDDKDRIQLNYIDVAVKDGDKILFSNVTVYSPFSSQDAKLIDSVLNPYLESTNKTIKESLSTSKNIIQPKTVNKDIIDASGAIIETFKIINSIDFSPLSSEITKLTAEIEADLEKYASDLENRVKNLIIKILGGTRLTIGSVFNIMLNDYNQLLDKIYSVAEEAKRDTTRTDKNIRDVIPFPTVVKTDNTTGGQTIVYPGAISKFKEWPEVKFVNNFVQSFFEAVRNNFLTEILNEKNENGSDKYIPFNSREIYASNSVNNVDNIYYNKITPQETSKLIYERFNLLSQITMPLSNVDDDVVKKWQFGSNDDTSFFSSFFGDLFGKKNINDENVKKNIFLTYIQFEARNIAYAITTNEDLKNWFKNIVKPQISNDNFFTTYTNSELTLNKSIDNRSPIQGIRKLDENYITVSSIGPTPISNVDSDDIITKYVKKLPTTEYQFTDTNLLYVPDVKLGDNNQESDYDVLSLKEYLEKNKNLKEIYNSSYLEVFDFDLLADKIKVSGLIEIPKGMLIIIAGYLFYSEGQNLNPTNKTWNIFGFNVFKDTNFYNYLKTLWTDFTTQYKYRIVFTPSQTDAPSEFSINLPSNVSLTEDDYKNVLSLFYEKQFISINDYRASSKNVTPGNIAQGDIYLFDTISDAKYLHYLQLLVPKVVEFFKEIQKKADDKFRAFEGSLKDDDVKLAVYKSMQVIYENYLHRVKKDSYKLILKDEFKFVDRAYNDISERCVLDMKTMLSDINDSNVSMLSAISRLLSDNNFWFYPFQGFLTTTENYNQLFDINYNKRTVTKPLFIAMYVGGLSSNPNTLANYPIKNDCILLNDGIPQDFKTGLNAFKVQFTGRQNQMVFSNFQHSTESLKNTDEGLRIQSDIINNGSNSFTIPKGQSLLNVYQKQSYSSTIKIPYGNMGIQPTQYYYEEFIPIFEGLYIIYNVTHSIDSDTQRLETTFKGYRLKKDTNPIVEQELVDFVKNNVYRRIRGDINITIINGQNINNTALKATDTLSIFTAGQQRKKYYELTVHHDPLIVKKHVVTSAGNREWNVAYRKSNYVKTFKDTANFSTIENTNNAGNYVVADMVIKKGGSIAGIPAPFNGKVVDLFKDGGNNSVMCLLSDDNNKTMVILHFENAKVKKSDTFTKGQTLAIQGNVGQSEGVHLHLEMMKLEDYIDYINFILSVSTNYNGNSVLT